MLGLGNLWNFFRTSRQSKKKKVPQLTRLLPTKNTLHFRSFSSFIGFMIAKEDLSVLVSGWKEENTLRFFLVVFSLCTFFHSSWFVFYGRVWLSNGIIYELADWYFSGFWMVYHHRSSSCVRTRGVRVWENISSVFEADEEEAKLMRKISSQDIFPNKICYKHGFSLILCFLIRSISTFLLLCFFFDQINFPILVSIFFSSLNKHEKSDIFLSNF